MHNAEVWDAKFYIRLVIRVDLTSKCHLNKDRKKGEAVHCVDICEKSIKDVKRDGENCR